MYKPEAHGTETRSATATVACTSLMFRSMAFLANGRPDRHITE